MELYNDWDLIAGSFHGQTLSCLTTTHSRSIFKLDFPALDWPIASFPRYKYPLEEFAEENKAEDRKCLAEVEEEFERFNKSGRFVAGVIIEPVQAEGGDVHASPEFFQELQRITKKVPGVYRFVPNKIGIVSLILL
jgi:4-aminobutyrate aminotransferase/(S)-3-amino-2-methylpropionate transaminase